MFKVTRDAVQVWLDDVEVFEVGVEQVNGWIESGRLDRFYSRIPGKYVVVCCGACFGRDGWECLNELGGVRVVVLSACDTLSEAMNEIRFQVEFDLFTEIGTYYRYDYEIWHLCDDSVLHVESLLAGRPSFSDLSGVVEYVETSLGDFAPEFDCWKIAQAIGLYVNGLYYVVKDDDEYWRCVASHELA